MANSAQVHKAYGVVSVRRDPLYGLEVTPKQYVDNKWVVGDIKHSVRNTDHMGWLLCDGRSLSRESYPELFAIIGTAFGSSSGTTFNLPNCRGRVIGTIGTGSGLSARSLGDTVGAETHTLTVAEMPSHSHTITDPGHSHSIPLQSEGFADMGPDDDVTNGSGYNSSISTTGITVNNTGGGGAHNNMQPTIFMGNVFIQCGTWSVQGVITTLS